MKRLYIFILMCIFCSCGKKYTYFCTTRYGSNYNGIVGNVPPYIHDFTDAQARRYERKNSSNDNGDFHIIAANEIQTTCIK